MFAFLIFTGLVGCSLQRGGICNPDPPHFCGRLVDASADAEVRDALPTEDGGDAGDAGLLVDAEIDSGTVDSGFDAGSEDSGTPDGGPGDSGPVDSGPDDSGPVDTGTPDGGPEDAGSDAGRPPCEVYPGICVRFNDNPGNPPVVSYWSRVRNAGGPIIPWANYCEGGVQTISARVTECYLDLASATMGRELWFYPAYNTGGTTPVSIPASGPISGYEVYIGGVRFPDGSLRSMRAMPGDYPPSVDSPNVVVDLP